MSAENELIKDAHFGYFKLLQEKLAEKRDISLVKTYFSHFKKNPYGCAGFKGCLEFLTEVILQQMNEKYEDNKTKYKSKEEFEEYQGGLFDVLAEMNDYLWENYLFLDRSLRWEYVDKVISKIDGDCFKRFLYTKKPKKTELETPGDREKINAYNKVLESFFYRNIRSLILSKQQCHDLFIAFHENVDKLPDWIDQYIDPSNQNDFLTTLSGDFVTLTDKIKSFDWSKKLDKNNKMARECLEDIKKVNEDVKNPGLFDFYAQFLETAIIPQINEREFKAKYYPDGKKDEKNDNQAEENYNKHQNQLLDILVETNDLIWEIIDSNSLSEYEKNRLSACYYNFIKKIDGYALERIGDLLNERKEKAMKSKNKNEVAEYNKLVKNFILRNLENSVMSVDRIDEMGVVNLIDEETFEEYTDDSMLKKLFDLSACFACNGSRIDNQIRLNSAIKIRKSDKNKKICLEAMFGGMMSGIHWCSTDNMLGLLKNSSDEIDFSFSSLSSKDVESSEEIKKFYLGFRSAYDDLKKNDFTVNISKLSLDDIKYFMYLGSWIVPFFPEDVDFDTVYTELSKRLDFLCDSHYDLPKQKIDQKQKDKLIIQALVYAKNNLFPLLECNKKSFYRTLSMFTGEEKFVEGYKLSLDDMKKILSCTKNSVLNSFTVLKFCKDCRAKDVQLFDILKLAKNMGISVSGSQSTGRNVCLENDRNARLGNTGYHSITYNLFNKNDFWTYMSESPKNLEEKEFDTWFSFFLTKPILPEKRTSDENEKIREFFIQVIDKIPAEYLQLEKFISLINYFANHNTANAINLNFNEFNNLISKMNKQMGKKDFETFKAITMEYCTISGRKISDRDIECAYNNVMDINKGEIKNENNNQGAPNPVYFNINEFDPKDYNGLLSNDQKNKNMNNVEDMNINKDINKDEIENEDNNQSVAKPIINEVEPKDSTDSPMNNSQNKNNSAYNIEIAQIKAKIKELQDRRVSLDEQISNMKDIAGELSNRNWFVRKFLMVFYYILRLIKESELNKMDTQLNKLRNQLTEMGSTDQTDISDRISYPPATEQTIPDMQRDGIVPNQNQ